MSQRPHAHSGRPGEVGWSVGKDKYLVVYFFIVFSPGVQSLYENCHYHYRYHYVRHVIVIIIMITITSFFLISIMITEIIIHGSDKIEPSKIVDIYRFMCHIESTVHH